MTNSEAEKMLVGSIEEMKAFIEESHKTLDKLSEHQDQVQSSIRGCTTDLNRAQRALDALRGDDEPKPMQGDSAERAMPQHISGGIGNDAHKIKGTIYGKDRYER